MSTLGYKIGLFNSMYMLFPKWKTRIWTCKTYPALITLEIPDDAAVSTPGVRMNIYKHFNMAYEPIEPFTDDLLKDLFVERCAYETVDDKFIHKKDAFTFLRDFRFYFENYKCRCSKAKVINIELLEEDSYVTSAFTYYHKTFYKRGEMVYPDNFDEELRCVCSHGIHYFEDPRLAILYTFNCYPLSVYNILDHSEYICHKYFDIAVKED